MKFKLNNDGFPTNKNIFFIFVINMKFYIHSCVIKSEIT